MRQKGHTLTEHLVALFIFSIGLLGLLKAQLLALNHYQAAYRYLLAASQLTSLLEISYASSDNGNVAEWNKETATLLPQAVSSVSLDSSSIDIQLQWWQQGNALPFIFCQANYQCIHWQI